MLFEIVSRNLFVRKRFKPRNQIKDSVEERKCKPTKK